MCELSTKLVAWLDGELPDSEVAELGEHLHACSECRGCLDRYKNVSAMVSAYCDATLAAKEPKRTMPHWSPVLATAACLAMLFAALVRSRIERAPARPSAAIVASAPVASAPEFAAPAVAARTPSAKAHLVKNRELGRPAEAVTSRPKSQNRETASLPVGPAIEIAIPGDALLPPGALPPGIGFVADVSIASDGWAQRVQLHPQLTGFEGRPNQ